MLAGDFVTMLAAMATGFFAALAADRAHDLGLESDTGIMQAIVLFSLLVIFYCLAKEPHDGDGPG